MLDEYRETLLKLYPDASVALIGCRATEEYYPVCEYDFLIISEDNPRLTRDKFGEAYVDLLIVPQKSIFSADRELSLALKEMNVISDPKWIFATAIASLDDTKIRRFRCGSYRRSITHALTKIGRFEEALSSGVLDAASFWLQSAAYDYSKAVIIASGRLPRISHLGMQFRRCVEGVGSEVFESWSVAVSSDMATNVTVMRRLDALKMVLDILSRTSDLVDKEYWRQSYELAERKARYLMRSHNVVLSFEYVGVILSEALEQLYEMLCHLGRRTPIYSLIMTHLTEETIHHRVDRRIVKMLGLNTEERVLIDRGKGMKRLIRDGARTSKV